MHEPTEREIQLETLKTLNKIEQQIYWLIGLVGALVIGVIVKG